MPHREPAARRRRHARARLDRSLGGLFASLPCPDRRAILQRLLAAARRSRLLAVDELCDTAAPSVAVLQNLVARADAFVRTPETWPGCAGSADDAAASLVDHLLAPQPVPRPLHGAWRLPAGDRAQREQRWFLAYAHRTRLRRLDLPVALTRRMEHFVVSGPHHLTLLQALRRAEILGVGGSPELADVLTETPMARCVDDGPFWRSLAHFFARHEARLTPQQVGAIVDFVHAQRFERFEVRTPDGVEIIAPPQPDFSLAGRTVASMLRLVDRWHRELGRTAGPSLTWPAAPWRGFAMVRERRPDDHAVDPPPEVWEIVELTDSQALRRETAALHHCVASYATHCLRGRSSIWSLRLRRAGSIRPRVTIEVRPARGRIVQVRAACNARPSLEQSRLIERWAREEGLTIDELAGL